MQEVFVELYNWLGMTAIEGAVCSNDIRVSLPVLPLRLAASCVMNMLDGKSAERTKEELPELGKRYWAYEHMNSRIFHEHRWSRQ